MRLIETELCLGIRSANYARRMLESKGLTSDQKTIETHQRLHPIFNPRNEEEIMRNIVTLSNQIKYVRDIPHVYISFDEQSYKQLFFTVTMVRLRKSGSLSIAELFQASKSSVEYLHDRVKNVGTVRRNVPKEATVFRVSIPKADFLRADQSIDIFKARQCVVAEICRIVGEIRDYNGGIISKQNELLDTVAKLLGKLGPVNYFLWRTFSIRSARSLCAV